MPQQFIDKCCLCFKVFDWNNFPRLMSSCDHSICTSCLKDSFKNQNKVIQCSLCGSQQEIVEADLQYFPKNIALIKGMKGLALKKQSYSSQFVTPAKAVQNDQNSRSVNCSSGIKSSSYVHSEHSIGSNSLISKKNMPHHHNYQIQMCPTHNKQMQIICLTDFTRICPLCAVFGSHKQHELKTIDQTSQLLTQTLKQFQQLKTKKKTLDTKIKNSQFKTQITQKITCTKNRLTKQIKDKFSALKQALSTAQKNANDELNKRMKELYDKINGLVKQQCDFQPFFNDWIRTVQLQLAQTNRIGVKFQEIAQIYLDGPLKSIKQGHFYLSQIQGYIEQKKERLQNISDQVNIQVRQSLTKDIYNYLGVKFQDRSYPTYNQALPTPIFSDQRTRQPSMISMGLNSNSDMFSNISIPSNRLSLTNLNQLGQANTMTKKPIKVQFSSSQNFLSPNRDKAVSPNNMDIVRKVKRQKSKSMSKQQPLATNFLKSRIQSPSKKQIQTSSVQISEQRKKYLSATTQGIVQMFILDQKSETLDLCSFQMPDNQIAQLLQYVHNKKRIKCLKLSQNKMTNQGFAHILHLLKFTTNINLSSNLLTQEVLNSLIKSRQKVVNLRILNLGSNKVNQRKAKVYVEQLKRQGIIVTL